jgi:hypothetical protein
MIGRRWSASGRRTEVFGVSAQAPAAVRKVIYAPKEVPLGDAPKALERVNAGLRKIIRTRGHFPSDDAATKLLWLVLRNITAGWSRAAKDWKIAMNQFALLYPERFTVAPRDSKPRHTQSFGYISARDVSETL